MAVHRHAQPAERPLDPRDLPLVSALVPAYNYEQFVGRAIQSALDQDYPAERLEVVVVDDGSTDHTAEVVRELAARHPGRIRVIRQENSGYVAATARAMTEARGDMLALLDADDMWLPQKTRRQVETLTARAELSMVFCDMIVVDAEEGIVNPSLSAFLGDEPRLDLARILNHNIATQSAIMFRRDVLSHLLPIPAEITYADWWVTLQSARLAAIDFIREPLALYRIHGSNLTSNVAGAAAAREARKSIMFQRFALTHIALDGVPADQLEYVWQGVEDAATRQVTAAQSLFIEPLPVSEEDRDRAQALLAEANRRRVAGDVAGEAVHTLRALAFDPYRVGVRGRLSDAVARARYASQAPDPLDGATGFVLLADAEDLLAEPCLLSACAEHLAGACDIVLAIDATRLEPGRAGEQLQSLVAGLGLSDRHDLRMLAVVGERDEAQRNRMLQRADARYRSRPHDDDVLPVMTPATLCDLRQRVEARAAVHQQRHYRA